MKKTKLINKNILILLFLTVLVAEGLMGLYIPKQAEAADIDGLPQYLNNTYDQYISRVPDVNGKGNYTPSFRFILYSPNSPGNTPSTTVRVTRGGVPPNQTAPPRCENFTRDGTWGLTASRLDVDNARSGQITATGAVRLGCVNTSYGFRLEGILEDAYAPSQRFPGYAGTVIRLALDIDPQGDSTFADIETIGGSDRLSYVGDNSSSTPDSANGVSMSLPEGSGNTIATKFAPPCNSNVSTAYVWWKDADSGQDTNGDNIVYAELREFSNGYSNGFRTIARKNAGYGPGYDNFAFNPKAGAKYEIRFSPVRARSASHPANTIKVWSPFDSAAAFVECPPPPGPPECSGSWAHNLTGDSVYKFSFFDHAPNITNPSDTDISVNTGRSWAATSGAKSLKDADYKNSNDGNYSTSLPNEMQYLGGYIMIEKWEKYTNSNGFERQRYTRGSSVRPMCATASCSMSISGIIPGSNNGVVAGQNFDVELDITGTNLPGYLASQPLSIIADTPNTSDEWDGLIVNMPQGLGTQNFPNTYRAANFSLNMPNDLNPRQLRVYIGYPNLYSGRVSIPCGTSVNPYHWFDTSATPSIALTSDPENPTQVTATATIRRNGGQIDAPINSANLRITRNGNTEGVPTNVSGSPWASAGTVSVPQSQINAPGGVRSTGWNVGDRICARLTYDYKSGWLGPGNSVAQPTSGGPLEACDQITNRPYLSVYNGDVAAGGGGLGLACSNSGSISSYYKNAGSGAQFAAYAMDSISGFKSAFLRDGAFPSPNSPNGLTFGNTPSLGQYRQVDCATDFFEVDQYEDGDSRKNTTILGSVSVSGLSDGGQTLKEGNMNLDGGGFTGQHSVFVDGDVFITGNIVYTSTSWTNIAEIPYFNLVVRGNIYISQDVTQLDGRYIAQPRQDGTKGEIYTCAYASDDPARNISAGDPVPTNPGSELWSQCGGVNPPSGNPPNRRLVINGQFVAKTIHFLRTIDTLSNGVSRETTASSRAGEVFNLSPEIFLGQPATRPKSTSTSGEYQKITTLPPIL